MNIETANVNKTEKLNQSKQNSTVQNNDIKTSFAEELKDLKTEKSNSTEKTELDKNAELNKEVEPINPESSSFEEKVIKNDNVKQAINEMASVLTQLHQSEDITDESIKDKTFSAEYTDMINNEFNISENKDILPQMNPNMNFSGDGQPFSSFMNNNSNNKNENGYLGTNAKDLAEESAILSTMAENIALANRNLINEIPEEKTVVRNDAIKKVDTTSGITVETIVKYDSIIMNEADVEMFANLVEKGGIDLDSITNDNALKSVKVSKTLADMLFKAKESNQPLRIDFDNNISVIIRISRDGKISADFLPSSQVAEAYLKENLPLLKQRFDENNIKYDELNQRERKEQNREHNRKKGRNDE